MSGIAMEWAWLQPDLPASARLTLLAIAWHVNQNGAGAWPSVKTLAREAQISERAVQMALRILEARRLVRITERKLEGTKLHVTNIYQLPDFTKARAVLRQTVLGGEMVAGGGEMVAPPLVNSLRGGGEMVAGEPGIEPGSLEPGKKPGGARSARAPKAPPVDSAFLEALSERFLPSFNGNVDKVRRSIEKCRLGPSYQYSKDKRRTLEIWLEEDAERQPRSRRPVYAFESTASEEPPTDYYANAQAAILAGREGQ